MTSMRWNSRSCARNIKVRQGDMKLFTFAPKKRFYGDPQIRLLDPRNRSFAEVQELVASLPRPNNVKEFFALESLLKEFGFVDSPEGGLVLVECADPPRKP